MSLHTPLGARMYSMDLGSHHNAAKANFTLLDGLGLMKVIHLHDWMVNNLMGHSRRFSELINKNANLCEYSLNNIHREAKCKAAAFTALFFLNLFYPFFPSIKYLF